MFNSNNVPYLLSDMQYASRNVDEKYDTRQKFINQILDSFKLKITVHVFNTCTCTIALNPLSEHSKKATS